MGWRMLHALVGSRLLKTPKCYDEVLRGICRHANDTTGEAWPTNARLVEYTGYSTSSVQRARKYWQEKGVIEVLNNRGGRSRGPHVRIVWEKLNANEVPMGSKQNKRSGKRPKKNPWAG